MKIHEVFPIVVAQDKIDVHQEFKSRCFEELKTLWFNGYENQTPEHSGRCALHLNPNYKIFFDSLKRSVEKYLEIFEVDSYKLEFYVTKSWVGYHNKDTPQLKPHTHNASDISFCYYISSDESSDKFCVHRKENLNEVADALFETTNKYNLIRKFNSHNCNSYTITPHEGTVVIFPSKLIHSTLKKDNLTDRCVIAGDIKLCLKEEYKLYHQTLPHPNQWLSL